MPRRWLTIAPIGDLGRLPSDLMLPYYFTDRVSLSTIPEWLLAEKNPSMNDPLRPELRETIKDKTTYCIAVEYEADALGSPDPEWAGESPRAIQETATASVFDIFLSFWLVRPTSFYFREVAHIVTNDSEYVIRQIERYDPFCALQGYSNESYGIEELERVRLLFNSLRSLSIRGTIRTASQVTAQALPEQGWALRFLMLWLALESLFGPEEPRETTFRLSQRIALFLSADRSMAQELFSQVKASYAWRSKVVHGLRLARLKSQESQRLIVELEDVVRRSLMAVLSDSLLITKFDGGARERYLDGLVFK